MAVGTVAESPKPAPLIFAADFFRANEITRHSTDPNEQRWAAGLRGELLLSHQDQSSLV